MKIFPKSVSHWLNLYIGQDLWHGPEAGHNMAQTFHLYSQSHITIPQLMNIAIVGGSWGKRIYMVLKHNFKVKDCDFLRYVENLPFLSLIFSYILSIPHLNMLLDELNSIKSNS